MTRLTRLLLLLTAVLLLSATSAQASTDEQRLAADLPGASAAFPSCGTRLVVHLHADEALLAAYPTDPHVLGMGQNCEVWLRSNLPLVMFRFTLYHETYHATHCGCLADHSPEMDRVVAEALRRNHPTATRAKRAQRDHDRNRRQGSGRIARF